MTPADYKLRVIKMFKGPNARATDIHWMEMAGDKQETIDLYKGANATATEQQWKDMAERCYRVAEGEGFSHDGKVGHISAYIVTEEFGEPAIDPDLEIDNTLPTPEPPPEDILDNTLPEPEPPPVTRRKPDPDPEPKHHRRKNR